MFKSIAVFGVLEVLLILGPHACSAQRQAQTHSCPPGTELDRSDRGTPSECLPLKPPDSHTRIEWSNWARVGISLFTVFAIFKYSQMKEKEADAEVTRESAGASEMDLGFDLNQADYLVGAERALILVAAVPDADFSAVVHFRAANYGRISAEIIWTTAKQKTLNFGEELSGPRLTRPRNIELVKPKWIPPNGAGVEPIYKLELDSPTIADNHIPGSDLIERNKVTWVWGIVCYRDAVSSEEHETLFCYRFWQNSRHGTLGGPSAWNRST